ncbi:DUF2911 domain-containing protein [Pedobacter westerhofensis]|nr:DUF2911 domain-containing protein [Pedobacter westerhofensis]
MNNLKRASMLAFLMILAAHTIFAQDKKPERASPAKVAKGTINGAAVTINYSSPAVKGRKIWGELVPYDKTWRAGANEATTFETDKPLKIQGLSLPAGKYSLYAVPGEKSWKIIFNSQTGQWGIKRTGETTDDETKHVLTVTVHPVKSSSFNEQLSYVIAESGFSLLWENLAVPVNFK